MEIWKDVVGFEGRYTVSNTGRVFSYTKTVRVGNNGGTTQRGGIVLRQHKMKSGGHLRVYLADGSGKKKPLLVHRVVAAAFIQNPNNYPVINHIDGNPENNADWNLEWCTVAHNNACSIATGTRRIGNGKGEANSHAKLDDAAIHAMRARFTECGNAAQVAREFGLSPRHTWSICHHRLWPHLN